MESSSDVKLKLRTLLEESDLTHAPAAVRHLAGPGEMDSMEASLKDLEQTYSMRARYAVQRGSVAVGWAELVAGLQDALLNDGIKAKARLYFGNPDLTPLIFTNATTTRALGVLVTRAEHAGPTELDALRKELGSQNN
jgi:hypothetical protein